MIKKIKFSVLTPKEILGFSVREINDTSLYSCGYPLDNGCNSLYLGSTDNTKRCKTCNKDIGSCLGHFGHIKLAVPIYNPLFLDTCIKILRCVCFWCSSILASDDDNISFKIREEKRKTSKKNLRLLSNFLKGKKWLKISLNL